MLSHYDRFAARSPEWLLGWRILELLRIVPYRTLLLMFATLSATGVVMDNPKFPLERRSRDSVGQGLPGAPDPPHARREGDLTRIRLQHWIALADTALHPKPHKPKTPKTNDH